MALNPHNLAKKLDTIDGILKRYATIDPYKFENMTTHSNYSNREDEIPKLDRIPCYARSFQEVLYDRQKYEYYLTNNALLVINILTSYELIKELFMVAELKDSLFLYEFVGTSKYKSSNHK